MRVFSLKNCDTCRKALKELSAAGRSPEVIDVRADGITRDDLERFMSEFGDALVNRRSTTWRGLTEEERSGDPLELLIAHPTLMKRPVIDADGALYLGWTAQVRESLL